MAIRRVIPVFTTAIVFLLVFGGVSHAAAAVEPSNGSLLDYLQPVLDAFQKGEYMYAGSIALVFAVALARRYGTAHCKWLSTDAGAATLAFGFSFGSSLIAALAGGTQATASIVWHAFVIAVGAIGGYQVIKALVIRPYVEKLATKGPAWAHAPAQLILWVFQLQAPDRSSTPSAPVAPSTAT